MNINRKYLAQLIKTGEFPRHALRTLFRETYRNRFHFHVNHVNTQTMRYM